MTRVWVPRLLCPECRALLDTSDAGWQCDRCDARYERSAAGVSLLTATQSAAVDPFVRQYRVVRERDGFRRADPAYYRRLPDVDEGDPERPRWQLRRATWRHFEQRILRGRCAGARMLDLGAGNGWCSGRLAARGYACVAVDVIDDDVDGLGAVRHYPAPFFTVRADFESLPIASSQFEVVVFNGSFHYARRFDVAFGEALRVLAPGGTLVVMDSPMFRRTGDGARMVHERDRAFTERYGISRPVAHGMGYVTLAVMEELAGRHGLTSHFARSRGAVAWELRRVVGAWRSGRRAAEFGLWWGT